MHITYGSDHGIPTKLFGVEIFFQFFHPEHFKWAITSCPMNFGGGGLALKNSEFEPISELGVEFGFQRADDDDEQKPRRQSLKLVLKDFLLFLGEEVVWLQLFQSSCKVKMWRNL